MSHQVSEAVAAKAARYHAERRVNVIEADETGATVLVKGSASEPYEVVYNGSWTCSCPARLRCAHIEAASMVVQRGEFSEPDPELDKLLGIIKTWQPVPKETLPAKVTFPSQYGLDHP